ncbi:MAG: GNAT family N-acetyltransferase, partial [Candidatus Delongbacteria bacterium]|nr:GNAT family N-acetyltransferase [Candidatus Delongbacteria bacterium]
MNKFIKIDPIHDERWNAFISKSKDANMFHLPGWLKTLKDQYDYLVFAFCLEKDNEIVAGIPFCEVKSLLGKRKWISLPFSDFVPPLYSEDNNLEELLKYVIKAYNDDGQVKKLEIRYQLEVPSEFKANETDVLYLRELGMSNEDLLSSFKKNPVQRPIKKAIKSGLTYEIKNDISSIDEFYRIHLITRKKLGVPIQPKKFFYHFFENITKKEDGFIVIVKNDKGLVISAGILAGLNGNISIKYSASDRAYLKFRPNNIMFWATMEHANDLGYKVYDFGKTGIKQESLCQFKSFWGTERKKL